MEKSEKLKSLLKKKIEELEQDIKVRKRKSIILNVVHGTLVVLSVSAASTVCIIAPMLVPPVVIGVVSAVSAVSSVLSIKFNMKNRKSKISKAIKTLDSIRSRFDYLVYCNGDLTEDEYNKIFAEISNM